MFLNMFVLICGLLQHAACSELSVNPVMGGIVRRLSEGDDQWLHDMIQMAWPLVREIVENPHTFIYPNMRGMGYGWVESIVNVVVDLGADPPQISNFQVEKTSDSLISITIDIVVKVRSVKLFMRSTGTQLSDVYDVSVTLRTVHIDLAIPPEPLFMSLVNVWIANIPEMNMSVNAVVVGESQPFATFTRGAAIDMTKMMLGKMMVEQNAVIYMRKIKHRGPVEMVNMHRTPVAVMKIVVQDIVGEGMDDTYAIISCGALYKKIVPGAEMEGVMFNTADTYVDLQLYQERSSVRYQDPYLGQARIGLTEIQTEQRVDITDGVKGQVSLRACLAPVTQDLSKLAAGGAGIVRLHLREVAETWIDEQVMVHVAFMNSVGDASEEIQDMPSLPGSGLINRSFLWRVVALQGFKLKIQMEDAAGKKLFEETFDADSFVTGNTNTIQTEKSRLISFIDVYTIDDSNCEFVGPEGAPTYSMMRSWATEDAKSANIIVIILIVISLLIGTLLCCCCCIFFVASSRRRQAPIAATKPSPQPLAPPKKPATKASDKKPETQASDKKPETQASEKKKARKEVRSISLHSQIRGKRDAKDAKSTPHGTKTQWLHGAHSKNTSGDPLARKTNGGKRGDRSVKVSARKTSRWLREDTMTTQRLTVGSTSQVRTAPRGGRTSKTPSTSKKIS